MGERSVRNAEVRGSIPLCSTSDRPTVNEFKAVQTYTHDKLIRLKSATRNMVRPVLYRLHSPDLLNMQDDVPDDLEHFAILVQAIIGPSDGTGEEAFDFLVCTADEITDALHKDGFVFGKNYLIVKHYNYQFIFDVIDSLCNRISGSSWQEVAARLGSYAKWEFEDYVE